MSPGNRLIPLALLVFAASAAGAARGARDDDRRSAELQPGLTLPVRQSDISANHAGSNACLACHENEHRQWARSLHVQMTKPAADPHVAGDFSGVSFADNGRAYRMTMREGRRYVAVSHGGRPFETFEVHYTLGAKRVQGYLSRLPGGRLYVLPVFWHVAQRRWIDWAEITPVPDGVHDVRQIWNVSCFNCHATDLDQRFDVASQTYDTTWTEMGLGCEACHGPGRPHITLMEEWARNPGSVPPYDKSSANRGLSTTLRVFSPRSAEPRQVFDMCAYCHGNKHSMFIGFLPGQRLEDYALPMLVSHRMPPDDPQGDFWPDGRPSRFNRPQALTLSGCFIKGGATCTSCHVAHGSRQEHSLKVSIAQSDGLCTQCHQTLADAATVERHTHHPVSSPGSRCIECHMSDANWRLLIRRRDHTFAAPVPEITAKYGAPNGCTMCHDERTPEWAAAAMDRWYADSERRREAMRVADAFYAAGAGDPASLSALIPLAVDRSRGLLIRASAAEFLGQVYEAASGAAAQFSRAAPSQTSVDGPVRAVRGSELPRQQMTIPPELTTSVVNALIGAASDPEPTVRAVAVRSLGAIGDRRAIMPVVARLADPARVVRASAAEALLWMDVSTLPGAAGDVLSRAQDEYVSSLTAFPDIAANHASRGWLESARGRQEEAAQALDLAIGLDPQNVRAHVYRGIVAARTGEFAEAIAYWQTAKKLDPAYPNLDRLIEEAQRRLGAVK